MVDASTFGLKPDFPIAGVADLYAKKPYLESLMTQAQQGQLVGGMQTLGAGLQSLAQRKMAMAQALAAAKMYSATPEGQQMLGINQVSSSPQGQPVLQGQTASGGVGQAPVPNTPQVNPSDIATAMYGESPANMMTQMFERQKQRQEFGLQQQKQAFDAALRSQEIGIQGRRASAEEENNRIQRQLQTLLAGNTIKNEAAQRSQEANKTALEANKDIASHWFLHPVAAYNASKAIASTGQQNSTSTLPDVGQTIVHPSGVKITRTK